MSQRLLVRLRIANGPQIHKNVLAWPSEKLYIRMRRRHERATPCRTHHANWTIACVIDVCIHDYMSLSRRMHVLHHVKFMQRLIIRHESRNMQLSYEPITLFWAFRFHFHLHYMFRVRSLAENVSNKKTRPMKLKNVRSFVNFFPFKVELHLEGFGSVCTASLAMIYLGF